MTDTAMQPKPRPKKRSGVKELVAAYLAAGASLNELVTRRLPDGTIEVYVKPKAKHSAKLTALDKWKAENANFT